MQNKQKLASKLVKYSCKLKKGEKVLIEASVVDDDFLICLINEVYSIGAYPFVSITSPMVEKAIMLGNSEQYCSLKASYDRFRMEDMDAYIGIRGKNNIFEFSDIPHKNLKNNAVFYVKPIHFDIRVNKKWVILNYPTPSHAQQAGLSTEAFKDLYYKVCTLNYRKMDKALEPLKNLMERTEKVRIVSPGTDLTFSIKGMKAIKCSGECNIPDGEIYTAPIKNSMNGKITYNIPSVYENKRFDNVCFKVKDGKIVSAKANNNKIAINKILDIDEGARYFGEFSFGINPYITKPMLDILFDEKMCGSIHLTPGSCYDDAYNGNQSAIHWDLVLSQTEENGGGEIYFDDVLIRKNGLFVLDELKGLNPENLV